MDAPGELLEGAESNHGSHTLTGRREGRVEQDVADTGCVHHAVVVKVGWKWHPIVFIREQEEMVVNIHFVFNVKVKKEHTMKREIGETSFNIKQKLQSYNT